MENYGKETKKNQKKEQAKNLQEKIHGQTCSRQGPIRLQGQGRLAYQPAKKKTPVTSCYGQTGTRERPLEV